MGRLEKAAQIRRGLQLFVRTLTAEASMLEVADLYPVYAVGKTYVVGDVFSSGISAAGKTRLYQVIQAHTSVAEWTPDTAVSLYKRVGVTDSGVPIWAQPLGATDAYAKGDRVSYKGKIYKSLIDSNVWSPDAYPAGWAID